MYKIIKTKIYIFKQIFFNFFFLFLSLFLPSVCTLRELPKSSTPNLPKELISEGFFPKWAQRKKLGAEVRKKKFSSWGLTNILSFKIFLILIFWLNFIDSGDWEDSPESNSKIKKILYNEKILWKSLLTFFLVAPPPIFGLFPLAEEPLIKFINI